MSSCTHRGEGRKLFVACWIMSLVTIVCTHPASGAETRKLDYPVQLSLQHQAIVARSPYVGPSHNDLEVWSTGRLYDAMTFSVEPQDSSAGSRWLGYDVARREAVTLVEDINAACGVPTEGPGHRVYSGLHAEGKNYIGTGPAKGAGTFVGGCVIRDGVLVGRVPAGMAVVDLAEGDNKVYAVARAVSGQKQNFFQVLEDRLEPLPGPPKVDRRGEERVAPAVPAKSPVAQIPPHLLAVYGPVSGRGGPRAQRASAGADPQARILASLNEPSFIFVGPPRGENEAAHVYFWQPSMKEPEDLGQLARAEGGPLLHAYQVRRLPSGDFAILAGNQKVTAMQVYRNPLLARQAAVHYAMMEQAGADEKLPPVRVRYVDSFYRYADHADRGWGCIGFASDRKLYTAPMPHHPSAGCPIFRFDPMTEILETLGNFDQVAQNLKPGLMVNMIHTAPVEVVGRVLFLGQDPFYGEYDYPGMTPENMRYAGSPVVGYHIKNQAWENLGIPLPGKSLFGIKAAPSGRALYLGEGYQQMKWYVWPLDEEGMPAGEAKPMELQRNDLGQAHVAPDGKVYFLSLAAEGGGKFGPPCEVLQYDPQTAAVSVVAKIDLEQFKPRDKPFAEKDAKRANVAEWIEGQGNAEHVYGFISSVGLVFSFDTAKHEVKAAGQFDAAAEGYPLRGLYGTLGVVREQNKAFWFVRDFKAGGRNTRLLTLDLETGKAQRHGLVLDQKNRRFFEITQAAVGQGGRLYLCGQNYALPEDPYYAFRQQSDGGRKLDSGFYILEKLPD